MSKKITKVEAEMTLADPILSKIGDIMSDCDLGIDGIYRREVVSFETVTKVDSDYIESLKKTLAIGFEKDGWQVHKIVVKILS